MTEAPFGAITPSGAFCPSARLGSHSSPKPWERLDESSA